MSNLSDSDLGRLENQVSALQEQIFSLVTSQHRSLSSNIDPGQTTLAHIAICLIFMMSLPGITLFYSGAVRVKHLLNTALSCVTVAQVITFAWLCMGYSIALSPTHPTSHSYFIGDESRMWFSDLGVHSTHSNANAIPESTYCLLHLTQAIVAGCLLCGGFAGRMRFIAMVCFVVLWHLFVYCPLTHVFRHRDGFMNQANMLEYSSGKNCILAAGVSALASSYVIGKRVVYEERYESRSLLLCAFGVCMMWCGWFGFIVAPSRTFEMIAWAVLNTMLASSLSVCAWVTLEWNITGSPSVLGMLYGCLSGLAAITSGAGFVSHTGAVFIGLIAGIACYFGVKIKDIIHVDDVLDTFGIFAVGAAVGGICIGFFTEEKYSGVRGVFQGDGAQLLKQIYGILFTLGWSSVVTVLILVVLQYTIGIRVAEIAEVVGLDISQHGETVVAIPEKKLRKLIKETKPASSSPSSLDDGLDERHHDDERRLPKTSLPMPLPPTLPPSMLPKNPPRRQLKTPDSEGSAEEAEVPGFYTVPTAEEYDTPRDQRAARRPSTGTIPTDPLPGEHDDSFDIELQQIDELDSRSTTPQLFSGMSSEASLRAMDVRRSDGAEL